MVCQCGESCWWIFRCWPALQSGVKLLGHDLLSLRNITKFYLLKFCGGFLRLCSWGILACCLIVTSLSGVGLTVLLASWRELTGSSLFRKQFCRTDLVECLIARASKAFWSFLCWGVDPALQVSGGCVHSPCVHFPLCSPDGMVHTDPSSGPLTHFAICILLLSLPGDV